MEQMAPIQNVHTSFIVNNINVIKRIYKIEILRTTLNYMYYYYYELNTHR